MFNTERMPEREARVVSSVNRDMRSLGHVMRAGLTRDRHLGSAKSAM